MSTSLFRVAVLSLLLSFPVASMAQEPTAPGADLPLPSPRPEEDAPKAVEPVAPQNIAVPDEKPPVAEPAEPDDKPAPAYVSPEKARTVPEETAPPTPEMNATPTESTQAAAALLDAEACEKELRQRGVTFSVKPSISEEQCGVLRPVAIEKLSSGVSVAPDTLLLCRTALALDIWVTESAAKAVEDELAGEKLSGLAHASTYVCRDRASETQISEHSRGSAIDIAAFEFASGKRIEAAAQAPDSPEDRFLAAVRRAACGPFKTVLGPGTDADHATHFHLDIAARSNNSTYCR